MKIIGDDTKARQSIMRHAGLISVGGTIVVIIMFFLLGDVRENRGQVSESTNPHSVSADLANGDSNRMPFIMSQTVEKLRSEIDELSGADRLVKQRELVRLLMSARILDLAAIEQQQIADEVRTAVAWRLAGDLYFGWSRSLVSQGLPDPTIAKSGVNAYLEVLNLEPNNLDVRTDLASVYLDANDPMNAVKEIKQVLLQNPEHVQARFNYGVMLLQIGNRAKAIRQFEIVMENSDVGSTEYVQADEAIRRALGDSA